jgi:hypothetical protein
MHPNEHPQLMLHYFRMQLPNDFLCYQPGPALTHGKEMWDMLFAIHSARDLEDLWFITLEIEEETWKEAKKLGN